VDFSTWLYLFFFYCGELLCYIYIAVLQGHILDVNILHYTLHTTSSGIFSVQQKLVYVFNSPNTIDD
jgi:hypothetical protein